jgi:hypothetical protein
MPFDFQIKKGVREGWEPLVVRPVMPVADALYTKHSSSQRLYIQTSGSASAASGQESG